MPTMPESDVLINQCADVFPHVDMTTLALPATASNSHTVVYLCNKNMVIVPGHVDNTSFPVQVDERCHSVNSSDWLSVASLWSSALQKNPAVFPLRTSSSRPQWLCSISLAAADLVSSGLFTLCVLYADVHLSRRTQASLSGFSSVLMSGSGALVLMEARVYEASLRWLRVMVTLKVCVCCSSILSSSDNLMKGHQAKA